MTHQKVLDEYEAMTRTVRLAPESGEEEGGYVELHTCTRCYSLVDERWLAEHLAVHGAHPLIDDDHGGNFVRAQTQGFDVEYEWSGCQLVREEGFFQFPTKPSW